ncbi:MAG: class I SAM-dependent methyltransferase [Acidobacteria bacterium]|nr:class I SAM-dependent methyltransferase [Acidobacteriota bacterium]
MSPQTRSEEAAAYGRSFYDVYDSWYAHHKVEPIVAALGATPGPILELGIGTGRIALALAEAGAEVWGLDSSRDMLNALHVKPGSDRIHTFEADMARFAVAPARFALVVAAFNVMFNLPDRAALRNCFVSSAAALAPGGSLVVDSAVIAPSQSTIGGVGFADVDTSELVLTVSVQHPDEQVIRGQHIGVADGVVQLRPWILHYASPDELDELANAVGLESTRRCADWTGREWTRGDARHISWYTRSP